MQYRPTSPKIIAISAIALTFTTFGYAAEGANLPFPKAPSASTVGITLDESTHKWRVEPNRLPMEFHQCIPFRSNGKIEKINIKYID